MQTVNSKAKALGDLNSNFTGYEAIYSCILLVVFILAIRYTFKHGMFHLRKLVNSDKTKEDSYDSYG